MAQQEEGLAVNLQVEGWPLGLQPLNVRLRLMEHLRVAEDGAFLVSTPSISSESSSDLDTESTGSFFPERSTTLGSLIGIQSNSQPNESREEVLSTEQTRRRRGSARHRTWCGLMGCTNPDTAQDVISPSLAHFLHVERRSTGTQRRDFVGEVLGEVYNGEQALRRNTLFEDDRVLPPQPTGAPVRLDLAQASPNSSYLSGDWSASVPVFQGRRNETLAHRRDGACVYFPGLCLCVLSRSSIVG